MKATIYIPDDQAKTYEDAKQTLGESISKTFVKCLERELQTARLAKSQTERIVVEVWDSDTERATKKAFEGRFIIGAEKTPETFVFDEERTGIRGGGDYAVAVTKKDRLVVLSFDNDGNVTDMDVFADYDELRNEETQGRLPESLIAAVASELSIDHVEYLDI